MKFSKLIKKLPLLDCVFLFLIATFVIFYFVIFMTPGKLSWYNMVYNNFRLVVEAIISLL